MAAEPNSHSRAHTLGELVSPAQLYWIERGCEALGWTEAQANEVCRLMFSCPIADLSRAAASEFETYLARVKAHGASSHKHEHNCLKCTKLFKCSQQFCNSTLRRYCDGCTAAYFSEISEQPVIRISIVKVDL